MGTLELKNIHKSYGKLEVIHDVSIEIEDGEFVVFVGPSGCGKSTMLRMIAGLEHITKGDLIIDGARMNEETPTKRGIAMVFQSYALYPNMSVYQNMAFGLQQARLPKAEIHKLVMEAAETLQIVPLLKRRPGQLSGGQSQRVAIGRSIVRNPRIFLFDEPLSNLDAELRVHMRAEINSLHKRMQKTTVYVTHDQVEAMTLADRIVVFSDGVIEQVGSPLDLYNSPANKFVAGFLGSPRMNFIRGRYGDDGGPYVEVADGRLPLASSLELKPGSAVDVGLRPEHIEIVDAASGVLHANVNYAEHLGGQTLLYCDLNSTPGEPEEHITILVQGQHHFQAGERVGLNVSAKQTYCFDSDNGVVLLF